MSGVEKIIITADDDGIRLDRWFKRHYPMVGHGHLSKFLRKGYVRLDGKRAKTSDRVHAGQEVRVPPLSKEFEETPKEKRTQMKLSPADSKAIQEMVIYKDKMVIAINKPAGLPVQGGSGLAKHLDGMLDALKEEGYPRPKLVHRLDKDTSGVLLLARTAKAASELAKAFKDRNTKKTYWALVMGFPRHEQGRIDLKMDKVAGRSGERMEVSPEGKPSTTEFQRIEHAGRRATWMALRPITGRTHQLRLHMAYLEHPIVGDGKYGGKEAYLTGAVSKKMHLHARSIEIPLGGNKLNIIAPMPPHMVETWDMLDFDQSLGDHAFEEFED